ncbi:hypothetical protein [Chitinilyticum litopenaei]|uniref:hypothetical protein n=1 Tax=Chitinilyticum litopenaei TaxID=1121276 RepID=UPI0011863AA6|nr:hypothetical protein [Chitinilyticum litopenaei]
MMTFPAHAVNKCKIDGKTVYQDAPCPSGSGGVVRITDNRVQGARADQSGDVPMQEQSSSNRYQRQGINQDACDKAKRSYDMEQRAMKKVSAGKYDSIRSEYEAACGLRHGSIAAAEQAQADQKKAAAAERAKAAMAAADAIESQQKNNPKTSDINCSLGVCRDKYGKTYSEMSDLASKRSDGKVCWQKFDKLECR